MFRRFLQYLTASPLTDDPYERDQLFQTILDRRAAILIAPASTVPLAVMAANVTSHIWPFIWMAIDIALTALRWMIMVDAQGASNEQRRRQAVSLVALGALWMLSLGVAVYLSLTTGDTPLMIVAAVIGTAVACVVTSRNAATPRHALLLLMLLGIPFAAGMAASGMIIPGILTIIWLSSLYMFVLQNHASTLRLIKAETAARRAAETDELTGLYNRMHFAERRAHLDASTEEASYGFLCIDLDGFKAVNDEHGHAVGDLLLRSVSDRIRRNIRPCDTLFRLGGDEFVALLPSATRKDCTSIAERLVDVLSTPFELREGVVVRIGASIGSACTSDRKTNSATLLHSADTAMYIAKANGKGGHIHAPSHRRFAS